MVIMFFMWEKLYFLLQKMFWFFVIHSYRLSNSSVIVLTHVYIKIFAGMEPIDWTKSFRSGDHKMISSCVLSFFVPHYFQLRAKTVSTQNMDLVTQVQTVYGYRFASFDGGSLHLLIAVQNISTAENM